MAENAPNGNLAANVNRLRDFLDSGIVSMEEQISKTGGLYVRFLSLLKTLSHDVIAYCKMDELPGKL